MPRITFTRNLQRHIRCHDAEVGGDTVARSLAAAFAEQPGLRGYVLDEQGRLRTHMLVFVDGCLVHDRVRLSDNVHADSEIYVAQALSGG
jgi:molybdopterin synthase sulfur carrier subunit